MAKKKKEVELKEVSRTEINGAIVIKYEDGSVKIIPAPIMLSAEKAEDLFGSESDDEEEEEEEEEAEEEEDKLFNYNRQSIQNLLITTFNEKWFCNRIT